MPKSMQTRQGWYHSEGKFTSHPCIVYTLVSNCNVKRCSTTIPSWKMAAHKGAFMSLFTRQSGGQRVSPSQDSEDTQQQFSHARPRSIKVFLPAFYPWRHSREKMYQALSCFSILQVTESWAGPGNEAMISMQRQVSTHEAIRHHWSYGNINLMMPYGVIGWSRIKLHDYMKHIDYKLHVHKG